MNGEYWWVRAHDAGLAVALFHSDAEGAGYFLIVGCSDRDYGINEVELIARIDPPLEPVPPQTSLEFSSPGLKQ
jgi:hypothetical protein